MNQEEFDNKLNDAFKNEYLPPNEKLWQNISERLENKKKKPFWYWLMPLVLVLVTATAVFFSGKKESNKKAIATNAQISNEENATNALINNSNANNNTINNNNIATNIDTAEEIKSKIHVIALAYSESETTPTQKNTATKTPKNKAKLTDKNKLVIRDKPNNTVSDKGNSNINTSNTEFDYEPITRLLPIYSYKRITTIGSFMQFKNLIEYEPIALNKLPSKINKNNNGSKDRTADFDKKWWWSVGVGPQLAINNMKTNDTLEPYVHKQLWKNKEKITSNGTGFQSQFLVGYKINKHFSIEAGLQYSLRTESIRLNEESDSIAFRSSNGTIGAYRRVILLAILQNPITGQKDTTPYNAIQAFTMFTNNKYHAITIPLKINSEFNITQKTKFQFGLGIGLTYLYAKKIEHFNMVSEESFISKKQSMFTASYNTQLAFYTNFNDYGEIGVYTGFQGYLNRWNVINKQYSIGMSDMQMGLTFRRPF